MLSEDQAASLLRRTQNEVMFRYVNEKIKDMNEGFEEMTDSPSGFLCECDQLECAEHVHLRVAEYERIRLDRTLFVVKVGHESGIDLEQVVERADEFLVVKKRANDLTA